MEQQQQHQLITSMAGQHQQLLGQLGSGKRPHLKFMLYILQAKRQGYSSQTVKVSNIFHKTTVH